ncbi:hypothetical protein [Dactylosporangium sp. NPDC049140]|uniref:hypothetical protein n=1 Tax=Dactylosporangium sp. NPDC049140 TaxID=3155647 RepID=UPI0033E2FABB
MPDLGAIHENVRFDWAAADRLAGELRASADVLTTQVGYRNTIAAQARQEWRGGFAEQFDGRMGSCTGDAQRLATALLRAADQVDELARTARQEQDRREQARAWEQRQHDEGNSETFKDFFTGEHDGPPVPPPVEPPKFVITETACSTRNG